MAEPQIDDRRAAIAAAFDAGEAEENPPIEAASDPEPTPEPETPPPTDGTPSEPDVELAPGSEESSTEPTPVVPETPPAAAEQATEPGPGDSEVQEYAAPVGWRGAARQEWAKVPKQVQEEVHKREREIGTAMRDGAEAKQFRTQFQEAIRPYEGLIASRGVDPLTATTAMMQTHAALTMGTPAQKAQTIAKAVAEYGVDIDQLAAAIDGGDPGQAPGGGNGGIDPAMQEYLDRQLAPVRELATNFQQNQRQVQQRVQVEAATEMDAFAADPQHPYFEDVRESMGDLMELAGKRGQSMGLDQAYITALSLHPTLTAPAPAPTPPGRSAAERRAAAASSLAPSTPVSASAPEPKTRREAIEQAIDKQMGSSV